MDRLTDPEKGIELKDRKQVLKVFKNAFIASELLDFCEKNFSFSRKNGIAFCQHLLQIGSIIPCSKDTKVFEDKPTLFFNFANENTDIDIVGDGVRIFLFFIFEILNYY